MLLLAYMTYYELVGIGSRREVIQRQHVVDVLNKIDPEYKKHAGPVIGKARELLSKTTGYHIILSSDIIGYSRESSNKKTDQIDYFLTNSLLQPPSTTPSSSSTTTPTSSKLAKVLLLAQAQTVNHQSAAYQTFLFLCFHAIMTAGGQKITGQDLLRAIRKVDKRFPETITSTKSSSAAHSIPIPELGDDFVGLLQKMKKVTAPTSSIIRR
jgi:hypothetical protein